MVRWTGRDEGTASDLRQHGWRALRAEGPVTYTVHVDGVATCEPTRAYLVALDHARSALREPHDVVTIVVEHEPVEAQYVVETCHEGSAWCARAATPAEVADEDEETLPLSEALRHAAATAAEFGTQWYDFTDAPAVSGGGSPDATR